MSDAVERLLEKVRSDVAAKALRRLEPARKVEQALAEYVRAVEGQVATDYARDHSIPSPRLAGDPSATARALLAAVRALPELSEQDEPRPGAAAAEQPETAQTTPAHSRPPSAITPARPSRSAAGASAPASSASAARDTLPVEWGPLIRCVQRSPLVLVGGVVRRDRIAFAPPEVLDRLEWIDTTRQGTHAIGNLAQRVKAGRVGALVLMEGLVGHRHSDPITHAAREANIPFEYAGKGGRAALARAFISVNHKAAADEEN